MPEIFRFFCSLVISLFLLFCIITGCSTETNFTTRQEEKYTLIKADTLIQFYVSTSNKKVSLNLSPDKYYTWYSRDSIYQTKGDFSGKLLNGTYVELYPNRALKLKGTYKQGLKEGVWKSWYPSGKMESMTTWDAGSKNGKFRKYDQEGKMSEEGSY